MLIADLHIHSKYSRATSSQCTPEHLDLWARRKGIDLVGTGDFTHPAWREELKEKLSPAESGLFTLKETYRIADLTAGDQHLPRFVLSAEISSIYKKNGKVRKVHNVILLPSFAAADALSARLEQIGNIHSDGRPILGLDSRDLLEITLSVCPEAVFIPAHIWTPHFSLFGAFSGFDTIEECFEDMTPYIHALETGLSSDPPMNHRLSVLDRYHMVSNSDAHSPQKLGREANLLDAELSYPGLAAALSDHSGSHLCGTIEFFPEEGKYHLDGHRNCNLRLEPEETVAYGGICPVCGKKLTIGVSHRVAELADRPAGFCPPGAKVFESLVPLPEVIAASMGVSASTGRKVQNKYEMLLRELGNEFYVLREAPFHDLEQAGGFPVAEGIRRMRQGEIHLEPGYDGVYGKIQLFGTDELAALSGQINLFGYSQVERKKQTAPAALPKREKSVVPEGPAQAILNERQKQAVVTETPACAVIAGPGTGKTKTLVSRIVYLVREKGVAPDQITAVTFTNKAAAELRERLEMQLGKARSRRMQIGTFHRICLHLMAQAQQRAVLIAPEEALALAADVLEENHAAIAPNIFLESVSFIKNHQVPEEKREVPAQLLNAYQTRLEAWHAVDFDDVLLHGLRLAEQTAFPCFTHLLVDEFQDVNPLQYRLLRAWAKDGASLFVIGDPDQSIYGFRGADAACFDRLAADIPSLQTIRLEENYRSTPEILSCALPVIGHNPGLPRVLHANCPTGVPVQVRVAQSDYREAIDIAKEIASLVGGVDMLAAHSGLVRENASFAFSDIAVLYRTHRQAEALEHCLRQEGIPYIVAGKDKTLSQPAVRGILGFFRFVRNEEDQISRAVALRFLFGKTQAGQQLMEQLARQYRERLMQQPPKTLIAQLLSDVTPVCGDQGLEALLCMAVTYADMDAFLSNLLLGEEPDVTRAGAEGYQSACVTLMTLHGAKGLEFPVVFLAGVRAGFLPLETERHTADVEEERRLFYVGMTRAREQLILLHSGTASPFLREIPAGCADIAAVEEKKYPDSGKQLSLFD